MIFRSNSTHFFITMHDFQILLIKKSLKIFEFDTLFMSGRSKNHTLKGGTSPYNLCMGVPPPPVQQLNYFTFEAPTRQSLFVNTLKTFKDGSTMGAYARNRMFLLNSKVSS